MPKALFILIWYIQIPCTPQSSDLANFDKQKNTTFFMSNVSFSFWKLDDNLQSYLGVR